MPAYSEITKVNADIKILEDHINELKANFSSSPFDIKNKQWVKLKLIHMVAMDQYTRSFIKIPLKNKYNKTEEKYFWSQFGKRLQEVDKANTMDLKALLKVHGWFKVSAFGKQADHNAWLLVQHADHDLEFQKNILEQLESLLKTKDTNPANYAYLYDRVAVSPQQKNKLKQRYGTQGQCRGEGLWEPHPIEDIDNLDQRRESVGLETMQDYKNKFKDICL